MFCHSRCITVTCCVTSGVVPTDLLSSSLSDGLVSLTPKVSLMETSGSDWTTGQKWGQWGNTIGSLKKLLSKDFKCTFLLCLMKAISILYGQIEHQNGQRHGITLNTAWILSSDEERITGIWQAQINLWRMERGDLLLFDLRVFTSILLWHYYLLTIICWFNSKCCA